jgi:hypothetical protein
MAEGRVAQTTNMVLGGGTLSEDSPDKWNIIDHQKVCFCHLSAQKQLRA